VYFLTATAAPAATHPARPRSLVVFMGFFTVFACLAAVAVGVHNLRIGRGDRKGALRVGASPSGRT
jgi:hypothetical protein